MIHATYFYRRKGNKIYSGRQFPQPMKSLLRHSSRARCKKGRPEKRFSIPGTKCPSISRTNHSRHLHRGVALYFQKHSKNDIFQNNKNFKMNLSPVSFSYIWCWAITIRTILLLIIGVQLSLYYFPFLSNILKARHLSFFIMLEKFYFLFFWHLLSRFVNGL